MDISTRCIHGFGPTRDLTGAVVTPIYQSATFAHPGVGQSTGYDYTRSGNPTRTSLEAKLAALEGGADALAVTSGMAAIALTLELVPSGGHVIASRDLYGGTRRLLDQVGRSRGITFTPVDTADAVRRELRPATALVLLETPTNPTMRIIDLGAVAQQLRGRNVLLAVDNTFLTPVLQRPLELGADLVLHSATKYLSGHNDTLAGAIVVGSELLGERLRALATAVGNVLAPFDCFLVERGLKTLAVRMERAEQSARALAAWLADHPLVDHVYYPGLTGHPGREVLERQADGYGAMIAFTVKSPQVAHTVLGEVQLIQFAESLGGTESLITYPAAQTHQEVPEPERLALGIDDRLLRLSVGLESVRDLLGDLTQAFDAADADGAAVQAVRLGQAN